MWIRLAVVMVRLGGVSCCWLYSKNIPLAPLAAYPSAPVPKVMSRVEMDGSVANRSNMLGRSDCGVLPSMRRC
jgi:hypothetical protein